MSIPIEDYALIGDRRTAALVSRAGSIDWLCLPQFDSPACFAALLGTPENGRWLIGPAAQARTTRRYLDGTLALEATHETDTGVVTVLDVMPSGDDRVDLIRTITGIQGTVTLTHELIIRFGYGRIAPWINRRTDTAHRLGGELIRAIAGPDMVVLRGPTLPKGAAHRHRGELVVHAGDELVFNLTWSPSYAGVPEPLDLTERIDQTLTESRQWLAECTYQGPYTEAVHTSLLTLRAMTDELTGGIVAAPTTSLPEDFGGERNWDYRYCWLRDASHTVNALVGTGMTDHVYAWRDWLLRAIAGDPQDLQIMYTVDGSRDLPERTLDYLPGYAQSRPVRVGNSAVDQRQSDVVGEVMMCLERLRDVGITPTRSAWGMQCALVNNLATRWQEPDSGLWEIRGPKRNFTHSRVHVWAAFDRGVQAAERHHLPAPLDLWRTVRDTVREEILERGYNAELNTFTQHYDTTEVDASLLLIPAVGFLPADDPRFVGTVERIEKDLLRDGLVRRYRTQSGVDGLAGDEHPFLVCSFWLVSAYAMMGRIDDASALMERLLSLRNDLGLLSEEYDPIGRRQVGNFPQAFSHLGLVGAAVALQQATAALSR